MTQQRLDNVLLLNCYNDDDVDRLDIETLARDCVGKNEE